MSSVLGGQVCLVTGGGGGIGAAICLLLAQSGARVGVVDRNLQGASETVAAIRKLGGEGSALECDISDHSNRIDLYQRAKVELGEIDLLVNNAADHGSRDKFLDVSYQEWERIVATNLGATWHFSQLVAPSMVQRGGR